MLVVLVWDGKLQSLHHAGMSSPPSDVKLALQRTSSTLLQQIEVDRHRLMIDN